MKQIIDDIMEDLDEQEKVREELLDISHRAIRKSSGAMALIHQKKYDEARERLDEVGEDIENLNGFLESYPQFLDHGALIAAFREYCEALITLRLIKGGKVPHPEDINVLNKAYAQALAEVEGELRRYLLDLLREDSVEEADQIHDRMEKIFDLLERFDYPDSILPGMKHRRDGARKTLEKTRADMTRAIREKKLERALKKVEGGESYE